MPLTDFYTGAKDGGLNMTQAWYDLSLSKKIEVVLQLEAQGLLESERTVYRLGSGLLQHSSGDAKADRPCKGVRTLSRKAKDADLAETPEYQAKMDLLAAALDEIAKGETDG